MNGQKNKLTHQIGCHASMNENQHKENQGHEHHWAEWQDQYKRQW